LFNSSSYRFFADNVNAFIQKRLCRCIMSNNNYSNVQLSAVFRL
jgi:hypothetical protein